MEGCLSPYIDTYVPNAKACQGRPLAKGPQDYKISLGIGFDSPSNGWSLAEFCVRLVQNHQQRQAQTKLEFLLADLATIGVVGRCQKEDLGLVGFDGLLYSILLGMGY